MSHTKERLVLTSQDDYPTGCANFESRYGVDPIVLYHDNAKADARRIVQCWNAHDDLVSELKAAHQIIRNALNLMTDSQKAKWAIANGDLIESGTTRFHERAAVIATATGSAS